MKKAISRSEELLVGAYDVYRPLIINYIANKTGDHELAKDLAQDTFLRLLSYKQMLCEDTIKNILFITARNLLYDYLRRYCRYQDVMDCFCRTAKQIDNDVESQIVADDLAEQEKMRLLLLPPQRRTIYSMSRYDDMAISEIARELQLSSRTIENHLFIGRKEVREFMKQCI